MKCASSQNHLKITRSEFFGDAHGMCFFLEVILVNSKSLPNEPNNALIPRYAIHSLNTLKK